MSCSIYSRNSEVKSSTGDCTTGNLNQLGVDEFQEGQSHSFSGNIIGDCDFFTINGVDGKSYVCSVYCKAISLALEVSNYGEEGLAISQLIIYTATYDDTKCTFSPGVIRNGTLGSDNCSLCDSDCD